MFYFSHLGYQVGRVNERLGSISPGNDCFYMRPASLQALDDLLHIQQPEMQGDVQFVEDHQIVGFPRESFPAAVSTFPSSYTVFFFG